MGIIFRADRVVPIQHVETGDGKHDGLFQPSYIPKFTTPEAFIEAKIKILQEHLYINLTVEDIIRLKKCKTETQVNNMVRTIISEHWG